MKPLLIALVAIFALGELGTELWYRWHETRAPRNTPWVFVWPDEEGSPIRKETRGFEEFKVAGEEILHFDRARGGAWRDGSGARWIVSMLEWDPGKKASAMDSRHNPMICLPSTGMELDRQLGQYVVDTPAGPVTFRGYIFRRDGQEAYVFSAVIRPLQIPEGTYRSGKWERRITQLEKALNGNRQSPERIVLISIQGPRSPEDAEAVLKRQFPALVRPIS